MKRYEKRLMDSIKGKIYKASRKNANDDKVTAKRISG